MLSIDSAYFALLHTHTPSPTSFRNRRGTKSLLGHTFGVGVLLFKDLRGRKRFPYSRDSPLLSPNGRGSDSR